MHIDLVQNLFISCFQILCEICHICYIIRLLMQLRLRLSALQTQQSIGPVHYFQAAKDLFSLLYNCSTMKRFWRNQQEYLNIFGISQGKFCGMLPQSIKNYVRTSYVSQNNIN